MRFNNLLSIYILNEVTVILTAKVSTADVKRVFLSFGLVVKIAEQTRFEKNVTELVFYFKC